MSVSKNHPVVKIQELYYKRFIFHISSYKEGGSYREDILFHSCLHGEQMFILIRKRQKTYPWTMDGTLILLIEPNEQKF